MLHPATRLEFISKEIGFGVVATERIPKGTITWVLCELDQRIRPRDVEELAPAYRALVDTYAYRDRRGVYILCWDHARFLNHHCEATCMGSEPDFEIAVRDIEPGEQLTDDYGSLNIEEPFDCACGSLRCRGTILPDDPDRLDDEWDRVVAAAWPSVERVAQPLLPFLRRPERIAEIVSGRRRTTSMREHYAPIRAVQPA